MNNEKIREIITRVEYEEKLARSVATEDYKRGIDDRFFAGRAEALAFVLRLFSGEVEP